MIRCGSNIRILVAGIVIWGASATASVHGQSLSEIRASHARVHDVSMQVDRTEIQQRELRRMENGNGIMELSNVKLYFLAPDRLRMEGKKGLLPVTVVENDDLQVIRVGPLFRDRNDLSDKVRRKTGAIQFGLMSGQVWQDHDVTVSGTKTLEGRQAVVLRLTARGDRPGSSYQRIWIDTETLRVMRRDRHSGNGKLKSRQVFRQPFQTSAGTWLSRRVDVHRENGNFVGALLLTNIRVNEGVPENLFRS